MSSAIPITVARGDGIGPEIMEAVLHIVEEAGSQLELEFVEAGEKVYAAGNLTGLDPAAWDSLARTKVLLQAPITAPPGGQAGALSGGVRQALGLFATVMPTVSYHPYVETKHPQLDVIVVRGDEEGPASGGEYRQSTDAIQSVQILSRPATERLIRYAFHYAQAHGRKKVICFTPEHSLGMSGELFRQIFDEIGVSYPEMAKAHSLAESGLAGLADDPGQFDLLVLPHLFGNFAAEIAAQISGSVGMVGCSSFGADGAMFEALHGPAPRIAGQNVANPSGLLLAALSMLRHIGQVDAAERAHNAWLKTIEDGIHSCDIFVDGVSKQKVGTKEFTKAVTEHLGQAPTKLKPVSYKNVNAAPFVPPAYHRPAVSKQLVGVDLLIEFLEGSPDELARKLQPLEADGLKLESIANRGLAVWPRSHSGAFLTDAFTCRFKLPDDARSALPHAAVVALLDRVAKSGAEFLHAELLYNFDGRPGFTRPFGG